MSKGTLTDPTGKYSLSLLAPFHPPLKKKINKKKKYKSTALWGNSEIKINKKF